MKSIKFLTIFIALCTLILAQDFSAVMTVAGGGQDYDLTFGFYPEATDGYDEGMDSYAPPPPPPPAFDAALNWGGDRYYTQILAGDGDLSEHVYDIALQYDSDNLITVTWDNTGWSDLMISCLLQDAFGGVFVNIDMLTGEGFANPAFASWDGSVLSLFSTAVNTLKLKVTPSEVDNPPVVGDIPDQSVTSGDSFTAFDLDDYLTELDGDEVAWSYAIEGQEPEPGFSATMTVTGSGVYYDLIFGFHPDATDGFDEGIDSYAPPAPPPPAFDAALSWGGDRYYTQILAGDADLSEHVYDIALAYAEDNLITLTWDNTGFSDLMTSCVLQDAFGGAFVNIDMITGEGTANAAFASWDGSVLSLFNTAVNTLKLKVTPLEVVQTREISVDIDAENVATITYTPDWIGSETIIFTATDQTAGMLSDSDNATFTVNVDNPPVVGDIPDQSVTSGDSFTAFDLDDYLTELDGNEVAWSYAIEGQEPEPGFSAAMTVAGGGQDYDLIFGFHPDATDGYDEGMDSYAPPAPPPPAFDAALSWGGDRFYAQILALDGDFSEHIYDIVLQYDSDNLITVSWDNTGWDDLGSFILQDAFGGAFINVNMVDGSGTVNGAFASLDASDPSQPVLSIFNTAVNTLKLKVTPLEAVQTREISVDIDAENVATITYTPEWIGSETIIFTATDQTAAMLSDSDDATFTVNPVPPPDNPWEGLVTPNPSSGYFLGQATIDGIPAVEGDWIAAFDDDGNIAGAQALTTFEGDAYINLAIYGDDNTTPDVDEGMNPGENFVLKLWDSSIDTILEYPESFDCWYNNNGAPMDGCGDLTEVYDFSTVTIDEISLNTGWNLISFDVALENNLPIDVFADLLDAGNLIMATGYGVNGSTFYDPALPDFLNTLDSIDNGFGYWVKVYSDATLVAEGVSLGDDFAKDLAADWNLIGYWLENSQAPVDAFAVLIDAGNLVMSTGFDVSGGTYYDPDLPPFLNTLFSLDNGFGYWVKVDEAVEGFQYPEPTTVVAKTVPRETNPGIIKTTVFMFVNGTVAFDQLDYTVGDMVNITTESGLLIGEMEILKDGLLMTGPVYGDDFTTEAIDGALEDEALIFKYNEHKSEPVNITFEGNMELSKVTLTFKSVPESFSLHQNYPNPFNPITTLRYDLPEQAQVTLTIYDLIGREVTRLVNTTQEAGFKSVQWDATDSYGKPMSAGVYLYQIQLGEFIQTKKMVLLK